MSEVIIECKDIKKEFKIGENITHALRGVSFKIKKGEYVAIVGTSGSGKSTLLNTLGLLDNPSSGQYILNGIDVSKYDDEMLTKTRLKKFGFIFQSFNLMNNTSCLNNVELPMIYNGVNKKQRQETSLKYMKMLGIENQAHKKPMTLSGGQRQRVAIARALVNSPEVIFADEPTGALDSETTKSILKILKELNEAGNTIIIVTHDNEVAKSAKRIIRISDGLIESDEVLK